MEFTERHFERLVSYNDCHDNRFFVVGHKRITFQNYVGVIQVGGLTIEILPKIDKLSVEKNVMQSLLVHMLHRAGNISLIQQDIASLKRTSGSLFDMYIGLFIQEVKCLIAQGLPKQYSMIQKNENFLRGRFLPAEQIKNNLVHKEKNYIEYQRYSIDHRFNQIIKKALLILTEQSSCQSVNAANLLTHFDTVVNRDITVKDFHYLHYNRNTECYRTAISIAELIISGYQPDLQYGGLNIAAFLFDMNLLFESYVAKEIYQKVIQRPMHDIVVKVQPSKVFWRHDAFPTGKTIRPDIIIETNGNTFVLDTKWKLLQDFFSSDDDLKQLYTYSMQFESTHVFLLYPSETNEHEIFDGYFQASKTRRIHDRRKISQWKIPLVIDGKLNHELGQQIIDTLA